jgi:hypothetical protein
LCMTEQCPDCAAQRRVVRPGGLRAPGAFSVVLDRLAGVRFFPSNLTVPAEPAGFVAGCALAGRDGLPRAACRREHGSCWTRGFGYDVDLNGSFRSAQCSARRGKRRRVTPRDLARFLTIL